MDKNTLKALKGSIKKWEKIVDGTGEDDGKYNCPLCQKFININCDGCPVAEKTKKSFCCGSPIDDWGDYCPNVMIPCKISDFPKSAQAKATRLAQAELDFLRSLLP